MEMRLEQAMKELSLSSPGIAKKIRYWSDSDKQMFFEKAGILEYHACFDRLLADRLAYMEVKPIHERKR